MNYTDFSAEVQAAVDMSLSEDSLLAVLDEYEEFGEVAEEDYISSGFNPIVASLVIEYNFDLNLVLCTIEEDCVAGNIVTAIKKFRELTGHGLKESKHIVDTLRPIYWPKEV